MIWLTLKTTDHVSTWCLIDLLYLYISVANIAQFPNPVMLFEYLVTMYNKKVHATVCDISKIYFIVMYNFGIAHG